MNTYPTACDRERDDLRDVLLPGLEPGHTSVTHGPASAPFGPGEGYVGTSYPLPRQPLPRQATLEEWDHEMHGAPLPEPPRARTGAWTRLLRWACGVLGGPTL